MNELDREIINLLMIAENNLSIDDKFYKDIDNIITELNKKLYAIHQKKAYRSMEEEKGIKPVSDEKIGIAIAAKLETLIKQAKDPEPDYAPSYLAKTKEGKSLHFSDCTVKSYIPALLFFGNFVPPSSLTLENIIDIRSYVLSIKKIFSLMGSSIGTNLFTMLSKTHLRLLWILQNFIALTNDTLRIMREEEFKSKEMGKLGIIKKERELKKIREHKWYSRLEKKYKKIKLLEGQGNNKEIDKLNKQIDNLIEKITGKDNKGTLRDYRNDLRKDFDL